MTIKLWDWDKGFSRARVFEGHTHYVMQITFNPKDTNTFASCSLDHTIKVWNLGSSVANFTLEGHSKGVNCVDYYHGGDKPYIASGADDNQIKIWDYQNKSCVQTLERHSQNVSVACFHPDLPIIISGSEDGGLNDRQLLGRATWNLNALARIFGTVRVWHANTYRLENTLEYALGRVWCVAHQKGGNHVAFGYDEGTVVIKLGREEPAVSMDNSGKIIWAKHNDIQTANVKTGSDADNIKDGERLSLPVKDLGNCEVHPQTLQHSRNGRFVVVCGDGEYIIYTALAWRSKSFGSALEFVWAIDSNEYAVRESTSTIKLFKNFKEKTDALPKLGYSAEGIFGGCLLGVKSASSLNLYDWDTGNVVRRIDVVPKNVYWADSGDYVAICCDDNFYILRYNKRAYLARLEKGPAISEEGVEEAFEFVTEIPENVKTGTWVGDCFIYTNTANRVNYVIGGQVNTVYHADRYVRNWRVISMSHAKPNKTPVYLLGYIPRDNRIYLCDKDVNVFSYSLSLAVIEYQTAVLREDMETAARLLPLIPQDQRNRIARLLESRNLRELAMEVSTDPEHKFDLAVHLGKLDVAVQIARVVDTE
ncbi:MAG: LOW QUALITY PROTEIN: coatomer WD associated region-domain-containing protein, partial [Olpidium bornovanus]